MSAETLMGLIMMAVIGPAIGNYATSVIYRLPLGQTPFEKHPYCGDCGTMLKPRDLFPIWSYVLSRGKCRYCGVSIRPSYTITEIACGLIFIGNFLALGFGELFLLYCAFGSFMVILAGLEYHQSRLYPIIVVFCFFLAAMPRLLADASLYPMVQSSFLCLFVSIVLWRIQQRFKRVSCLGTKAETATGYHVPKPVILAALAGIALPFAPALMAIWLGVVFYVLQRALWGWRFYSASAGLGIWVMLLAG